MDSNLILFIEEDITSCKLSEILLKFNAKHQESCWGIEKNNAWIWVDYYVLNNQHEIEEIWLNISSLYKEKTCNLNIKSAIFIQPSRESNSVFLALNFCKTIYSVFGLKNNIILYHERSGLFKNEEIDRLKFENTRKFYDYSLINEQITFNIIKSLYCEFSSGIECIEEDGGWEKDEIDEYIDLFYNIFIMREDLENKFTYEGKNKEIIKKLKKLDSLILKLLIIDDSKLLIQSNINNDNKLIKNWWWHLDKVNSGELVVNLKEEFIELHNNKISIYCL